MNKSKKIPSERCVWIWCLNTEAPDIDERKAFLPLANKSKWLADTTLDIALWNKVIYFVGFDLWIVTGV